MENVSSHRHGDRSRSRERNRSADRSHARDGLHGPNRAQGVWPDPRFPEMDELHWAANEPFRTTMCFYHINNFPFVDELPEHVSMDAALDVLDNSSHRALLKLFEALRSINALIRSLLVVRAYVTHQRDILGRRAREQRR